MNRKPKRHRDAAGNRLVPCDGDDLDAAGYPLFLFDEGTWWGPPMYGSTP
jgi:hypothetical protein